MSRGRSRPPSKTVAPVSEHRVRPTDSCGGSRALAWRRKNSETDNHSRHARSRISRGPSSLTFKESVATVLPYDKIAHQGSRGSRLTAQDIVSCGTRNAFQQEVKTPADISLRNGLKPREMPEASQECSRCVARNATTGRFPEGTQLVAGRWRPATPPDTGPKGPSPRRGYRGADFRFARRSNPALWHALTGCIALFIRKPGVPLRDTPRLPSLFPSGTKQPLAGSRREPQLVAGSWHLARPPAGSRGDPSP